MGCCGGDCSCGKEDRFSAGEGIYLVQIPASQKVVSSTDWMKSLFQLSLEEEVVEVRFKNGRKAFFRSLGGLAVSKDDRVIVECDKGYDLGTVSLSGEKARKQFEQRENAKSGLNRVSRKATVADLERWLNVKKREHGILLEARKIAFELELELTVTDVEFRGDGQKVTFYYASDGEVELSDLERRYASAFAVDLDLKPQFMEVTASLNRK
jgi:cell fate regulator YaaT (PSP1 superfamily)